MARAGFRSVTETRRSRQAAGFTLLEMLVALAVFSLAALAMIRLQAVAVRTTADLDQRQMARLVAHNEMVDLLTSPDVLATGEQEGKVSNGGRDWHWQRKVSKTGDRDVVRVDLRVTGAPDASPAVLTFLRAQPS